MVKMTVDFEKDFVANQKRKLLQMKMDILNQIRITQKDLHVPIEETMEEGDQASTYLLQNVTFGLKERELFRLREVELALSKIDMGKYGICEELDIPIEKKRLEKMPWARLCIEAAEDQERDMVSKRLL